MDRELFFSDITTDQLLEFLHQRIVNDGITFVIIYGIHNIALNKKDAADLMADLDYFLSNLRKLQNEALANNNPCTIMLLCLSHPRYADENNCIPAFNPEWPVEINTKNSRDIIKKVFPIGCAKLFEIPKDNPKPTKAFVG